MGDLFQAENEWRDRKMRKHRRLIGCILIPILLCGFVYFNLGWIMDSLCEQDNILAELDAGNNRSITISGESCWEVGRGLHYEVKDQGKIVSPKFLFDVDEGHDSDHRYSLIYAENKSLVAVLDVKAAPPRVMAVYDFKSGDTWSTYHNETLGSYTQKVRDLFLKLQQENPGLIIPPDYQYNG
jgi:hypothetical protein